MLQIWVVCFVGQINLIMVEIQVLIHGIHLLLQICRLCFQDVLISTNQLIHGIQLLSQI